MKHIPVAPSEYSAAIGPRIRAAREVRGMTIDDVSVATGLSRSFLSRVERDQSNPSLTALLHICRAIGVSPGTILDPPTITVVNKNEGAHVDLGGQGIKEQLLTPADRRDVQLIHTIIAPGGHGEAELYTVDCTVETIHVVTGSLTLRTTAEDIHLGAGDTATFPGSEPHTWVGDAQQETEVLWVLVRALGSF